MQGKNEKKVEKKLVRRSRPDPFSWERKWSALRTTDGKEVNALARAYMDHLGRCKTERESASYFRERLLSEGFIELTSDTKATISPGDGLFMVNRGREVLAAIAGEKGLEEGMNVIVTHLDSPRLDLKPLPMDGDADTGLGFFRTHYYGGMKKYQWVNIPLALHGVVVKGGGGTVELKVGEAEGDPVFVVPDLMPHLSKKVQDNRRLSDGIRGEELLALYGQGKARKQEEDKRPEVVLDILGLLNREYGIVEEDLVSSDLCLVPAWPPREIGLDKGLIGAYGQDNRISSFCAIQSIISAKKAKRRPKRWAMVLCFDKEEIGSEGSTGARSFFMELCIYRLMELSGLRCNRRSLNRVLSSSFAISADVKSGVNPVFKGVQDPTNSARLGAGLTITKYTGKGGKSGAHDASAEMVSGIRRLFNAEKVAWQMQETGKVDMGGGGTVSKFIAARNMDVLDCGIPLLSMHSPLEVASKLDIATACSGFSAFLEKYPL